MPTVLKSARLNHLEPSGSVQGLNSLYRMDCVCRQKNTGILLKQVKRLQLAKSKEETADLRNFEATDGRIMRCLSYRRKSSLWRSWKRRGIMVERGELFDAGGTKNIAQKFSRTGQFRLTSVFTHCAIRTSLLAYWLRDAPPV